MARCSSPVQLNGKNRDLEIVRVELMKVWSDAPGRLIAGVMLPPAALAGLMGMRRAWLAATRSAVESRATAGMKPTSSRDTTLSAA